MLNITGLNRFFLVRDFHDMRCKYDKVLSIIHQQLNREPEDGDVFIVMSKDLYCCPIKLDNNKNSVLDC